MIRLAIIFFLASSPLATAQDLSLPGGRVNRIDTNPATSVRLPTEPWSTDAVVPEMEGAIRRTAYQLDGSSRTTLQLIAPARTALEDAGYTTVFACADASCGGFDFRFQLDLLPDPDMYVDLGDFRYLLMQKDGATPHTVSIVGSAAASAGFLHVTEVFDAVLPEGTETTTPTVAPNLPTNEQLSTLEIEGRLVLGDLEFQTGATDLGDGPFASLAVLAAWLDANPSARVVLVGHTDAVGSLEANTSLSQRRAAAVADRLVNNFGVDPAQLDSAGVGYLAPIASNLTPEGRSANRRVEVVLLALE